MSALPAAALFATLAFKLPAIAADYTVELEATADESVPRGETYCLNARGEARARSEDDELVIDFEASDLVPDEGR